MKSALAFDCWDLAAAVALVLILVGLFAWHWPAALVAIGSAILLLYVHREVRLAAKPTDGQRTDR
jgi:membrane protein implicated in regulation of membrane protease activity